MVYKLCPGAYHVLKSLIAFGLHNFVSGVNISIDSAHSHHFEERTALMSLLFFSHWVCVERKLEFAN